MIFQRKIYLNPLLKRLQKYKYAFVVSVVGEFPFGAGTFLKCEIKRVDCSQETEEI
jgi:hypothetical protein